MWDWFGCLLGDPVRLCVGVTCHHALQEAPGRGRRPLLFPVLTRVVQSLGPAVKFSPEGPCCPGQRSGSICKFASPAPGGCTCVHTQTRSFSAGVHMCAHADTQLLCRGACVCTCRHAASLQGCMYVHTQAQLPHRSACVCADTQLLHRSAHVCTHRHTAYISSTVP